MICETLFCFALLVGIENNNILENESYFFVYKTIEECENNKSTKKNYIIKTMINENDNNDNNFNEKYKNFLNEKITVKCEKIDKNVFIINEQDIDSYIGMMNRHLLLIFFKNK